MKQITSSPLRFERVQGLYVVTCLNLADSNTGEHMGSMHQAMSRVSFSDAKRQFWAEWQIDMPDCYLTPRTDA